VPSDRHKGKRDGEKEREREREGERERHGRGLGTKRIKRTKKQRIFFKNFVFSILAKSVPSFPKLGWSESLSNSDIH
jgi:hypothetical protein